MKFTSFFLICILFAIHFEIINCDELWEQDLSKSMDIIQPSTEGLQKVHLKCGANSMQVELETEEEFTGVMYTRGSYHRQNGPCFGRGKGSRALSMKFPLDDCQTLKDGEVFSNVVVVQHDPDLVTPGDAAFSVECDFREPREVKVAADLTAGEKEATASKISLESPDPSASVRRRKRDTIRSRSNSVTFTPKHLRFSRF